MTILKKTVSLSPGQSKVVGFTFTPTEARAYQVLVNGLTGNFVAVTAPPPGLIGDLNDDGVVDLADLDILLKYLAGYPISEISPLSEAEFLYRADVNGDGAVNSLDITALEALIPGPPPPVGLLVPCVYCGARFSTEAQLISHMESSHPNQPYLISLDAPPAIGQSWKGNWVAVDIRGKGFMPNTPDDYELRTKFYIYRDDAIGSLYTTGYGASDALFYTEPGVIGSYGVEQAGAYYLPLGTYPIMSLCYLTTFDGHNYERSFVWKDAGTDLTMEVVETLPEPDIVVIAILVRIEVPVGSGYWREWPPHVGDNVQIVVTTENQGTEAGSKSFNVTIDGQKIGTVSSTNLPPNQRDGFKLYFTPTEARQYIAEAGDFIKAFTVLP